MISDENASLGIGDSDNAFIYDMPMENIGAAATVTPSALSVQIMNPSSLNNAAGVVYAGVVGTQMPIGGRTETWDAMGDNFVEFQRPRLLAAGKLALRGVKMDAYAMNMPEVGRFTPLSKQTPGKITYGLGSPEPVGWTPFVVYNTTGANLEFLITIEWRVRFDFSNPAVASHIDQGHASTAQWGSLIKRAMALGNGCVDIADAVANAGQLASRFMGRYQPPRMPLALEGPARLALT